MKSILNICFTMILLAGFVYAGERTVAAASSSGGKMTEEQIETARKRHEKIVEAIDLEVSIDGQSGRRTSGSFSLPEGELHYYYNMEITPYNGGDLRKSARELLNSQSHDAGKLTLKMGVISYKDDKPWWGEQLKNRSSETARGYRLFYGEEKYNETLSKLEKGEPVWIIGDELTLFQQAVKFGNKAPFTAEQKKTLTFSIEKQKKLYTNLYKVYRECLKTRSKRNVELLFSMFGSFVENRYVVSFSGGEGYSKLQNMLLRSDMMKHGSSSGYFDDGMGSVRYTAAGGRFNVTLTIKSKRSGKFLPYLLNRIFAETLGKDVTCTLDESLQNLNVNGKITFRSVEDGLDKFARKVGGKLVKNEDGSFAIVPK